MDHFLEEVVVKRKNGLNKAVYYLSWIIMIFSALIASMTLSTLTSAFSWFSVIVILVSAGCLVVRRRMARILAFSSRMLKGVVI